MMGSNTRNLNPNPFTLLLLHRHDMTVAVSMLLQVEALVAATLQTFHGVDILVSNAGIVRAADFLDMSEADFDEVVRVNLKGVFLVSRRAPSADVSHAVMLTMLIP